MFKVSERDNSNTRDLGVQNGDLEITSTIICIHLNNRKLHCDGKSQAEF